MLGYMHFILIVGFLGGVAADATKGSPLDSVVTMLEELQNKVLVEGKDEAKTYDKFACFCKDTSSEKADAIKTGEDQVAELEASITEEMEYRLQREQLIAETNKKLAALLKEREDRKAERKRQHEAFIRTRDEMNELRKQIKWAIVTLMAEDAGISAEELNRGRKMDHLSKKAKMNSTTQSNLANSHPGKKGPPSFWNSLSTDAIKPINYRMAALDKHGRILINTTNYRTAALNKQGRFLMPKSHNSHKSQPGKKAAALVKSHTSVVKSHASHKNSVKQHRFKT